ncbi:MAG: nucleotidyltransferase family protein [Deinococcota bacterium]
MIGHPITAVVLGGHDTRGNNAHGPNKPNEDALELPANVASKALLPYQGKPIASYVLDALTSCLQITQIIYVGALTPELTTKVDDHVPAGERLLDSLRAGLQHVSDDAHSILAIAADLPWLTPEAVDDLLTAASGFAATYPVVTKATMHAQFPNQARTYARLHEAEVTGGNAFVFTKAALPRILPFVERAHKHRKNPLFLAQLTGFDAVIRYLFGRLSLAGLEARASYLLDIPAHAHASPYPALAADVDKASHLLDMQN